MKRWIALSLSILMLLSLAACGSRPTEDEGEQVQTGAATDPSREPVAADYVYQLDEYGIFFDFFQGKDLEELGQYTIELEGLSTPVVVGMDGMDIVSVSAFGKTHEIFCHQSFAQGEGEDDGDDVVVFKSAKDVVIVDYAWMIGPTGCYECPREDVTLHVREDGTVEYYFYSPLDELASQFPPLILGHLTSGEECLFEKGSATIVDGQMVLTMEEHTTVADCYDLEELFQEGKQQRLYEQFETLEELLEHNREKNDDRADCPPS